MTMLPHKLALLPLENVVLLPGGYLPLTISDAGQIAVIDAALQQDRLLGLAQPRAIEQHVPSPFYSVGCMGRITAFAEIAKGIYQITVFGVCRFDLVGEIAAEKFSYGVTRWERFEADLQMTAPAAQQDNNWRAQLEKAVQSYFISMDLSIDIDALKVLDGEKLIATLSMICPFAPPEKQALLEASTHEERSKVLLSMIEMSMLQGKEGFHGPKH